MKCLVNETKLEISNEEILEVIKTNTSLLETIEKKDDIDVIIIGLGLFMSLNKIFFKRSDIGNAALITKGKEKILKATNNIEYLSSVRISDVVGSTYCLFCLSKAFCSQQNHEDDDKEDNDEEDDDEEDDDKDDEEHSKFDEMITSSSMRCLNCKFGCVPLGTLKCTQCNDDKTTSKQLKKYQELKAELVLPENFKNFEKKIKSLPPLEKYEELFEKAFEIFHPYDITYQKLRKLANYSICGELDHINPKIIETVSKSKMILLHKIQMVHLIQMRHLLAPFDRRIATKQWEIAMLCAFIGDHKEADIAFERFHEIVKVCPGYDPSAISHEFSTDISLFQEAKWCFRKNGFKKKKLKYGDEFIQKHLVKK